MPHKYYVKSKLWPYDKILAVFSVGNVVNHAIEKAQQLDYKALEII